MFLIFFLPVLVLSVWIFYEDFSSRAVNWILFPLLAVSGIFMSLYNLNSFAQVLKNALYNFGFLIIQFLLLKIYFQFRKQQGFKIINKKIGLGDILFLSASCFYFSLLNFLLFYILSLIFALIFYLFFFKKKSFAQPEETVPLAGLQSIFLIIFICTNKACSINITMDDWLLPK